MKEYINIIRCYKCHGYGHVAKVCNTRDQLCYKCGSNDHLRNNCPKKSAPECINCTRARRKEVKHEMHSENVQNISASWTYITTAFHGAKNRPNKCSRIRTNS